MLKSRLVRTSMNLLHLLRSQLFTFHFSPLPPSLPPSLLSLSPSLPPSLSLSSYLPPSPAVNQWAALCKALPGTTDGLNPWTQCNKDFEAVKVKPTNMPFVKLVNPTKWEDISPMDVETAPPLFALALGCGKRDDMERVYQDMLEFARHKGTYMYTCIYM